MPALDLRHRFSRRGHYNPSQRGQTYSRIDRRLGSDMYHIPHHSTITRFENDLAPRPPGVGPLSGPAWLSPQQWGGPQPDYGPRTFTTPPFMDPLGLTHRRSVGRGL